MVLARALYNGLQDALNKFPQILSKLAEGKAKSVQKANQTLGSSGGELVKSAVLTAPVQDDSLKPILQISEVPELIELKDYENSYSLSNQNGSYTNLQNFSRLTNAIPEFTEYYWASSLSLDQLYKTLVQNAAASPDAGAVASVISDARQAFEKAAISSMDGSGISWHPCYADPDNWYSSDATLLDLDIDFTNEETMKDKGFAFIGGGSEAVPTSLNVQTAAAKNFYTIGNKHIKIKYQIVHIQRPWLDTQRFSLSNWSVPGFPVAYYSSGSLEGNMGKMALIPTAFILIHQVVMSGEMKDEEQCALEEGINASANVSLGPIQISSGSDSSSLKTTVKDGVVEVNGHQILGWISEFVPLSPQLA
jgi:hypothetical protein